MKVFLIHFRHRAVTYVTLKTVAECHIFKNGKLWVTCCRRFKKEGFEDCIVLAKVRVHHPRF